MQVCAYMRACVCPLHACVCVRACMCVCVPCPQVLNKKGGGHGGLSNSCRNIEEKLLMSYHIIIMLISL